MENQAITPAVEQPQQQTSTNAATEQTSGAISLADLEAEQFQPRRKPQEQSAESDAEQVDGESEQTDEGAGESELPEGLEGFDRAEIEALAEQFGLDENDLQNPKILKMLAAKLAEQAEGEDSEQQESPEQKPEQPQSEQPAQPTQALTPENFQQYVEQVRTIVNDPSLNDPMMVQAFKNELLEWFDAQSPEAKASVDRFANAAMIGATNMISTLVPRIMQYQLASMIESILPGLAESHYDALAHNTWESVREDGKYHDLPKFGTPEFYSAAERVHKENPWLAEMDFKDAKGHPLPIREAMREKATLTAKLLAGEKFTPEMINKAVKQGEARATRASRRVSAGRMLGAGRSRGEIGHQQPYSSLMDAYHSREGKSFE